MTTDVTHLPSFPLDSQSLPLILISLENWGLVHLHGLDAQKYLQGQVTADVDALASTQHTLTAHCDPKGKMWSDLRLFHHLDGFSYIERSSVIESQLAELKKYAVFSKITFEQKSELKLLAVAGKGARKTLSTLFSTLPDDESQVVVDGNSTLLHFSLPNERFLIVTDEATAQKLADAIKTTTDDQQWLSLEIEAGYAVIDQESSAQHLPQATNLQALPYGISFKKGCYTGQEMVARAKFRGANKRAMYWLKGTAESVPAVGDGVEWQLGDKRRRTGNVLAAVKLANGEINIQIIMNNDMEADSVYRVTGDEQSHLTIQPLPYSLEEEK